MFAKSVIFTFVALLTAGSSLLIANPQPMANVALAIDTAATSASDTSATNSTDTTGTTATTDTAKAPENLVYTIEKRGPALSVHGNFPDAIKVTAKTKKTDTAEGMPVPDVKIKGLLRKGEKAKLFSGTEIKEEEIVVPTDTAGVASFGILTEDDPEVTVQIMPLLADEKVIEKEVQLVTLSGTLAFVSALGSKKSYLQLFLGQTFTNNFKADPESAQGENTNVGFSNGGPIIRLTFDTMWRFQDRQQPRAMNQGLFHTDANLEFSRFPFGKNAAEIEESNQQGLKDAFSGTLGLTWQPNLFTRFDERDPRDLLPQDPQPFDAYRFGIFGKMGVTTRAKSEPGGNTSVNRIQFGIRFTHSRSGKSNKLEEDRNEVPIRFVEMSYGRFSDWGRQDSASRLVIDGGLRITALSNEVFPIYVGAHLNTGPGEDDLRVFLGMLVKLDVLGRLVQGIAGAPAVP